MITTTDFSITPLVSVIMSTYNDETYIEEAVQSILNQTYKNIELIVVDDASTDETGHILDSFNDKRIHVFHNAINKKLAHNLNFAISNCNGKYIARMDADDVAEANRISEQVLFLECHSDVDVCGSYAQAFGNATNLMKYPVSHDEIKVALLFENALCHPAVMFRRDSMDFRYDESFPAGQDYELWSRIVWTKQIRNIPKPLLKYRVHEGQTKHKSGSVQKKGALIAKQNMLHHLLPTMTDRKVHIFTGITNNQKAKVELSEIEEILLNIISANLKNSVFNRDILQNYCGDVFFRAWYRSIEVKGVDYQVIKKSKFFYGYKNQPLNMKIKSRLKLSRKLLRGGGID